MESHSRLGWCARSPAIPAFADDIASSHSATGVTRSRDAVHYWYCHVALIAFCDLVKRRTKDLQLASTVACRESTHSGVLQISMQQSGRDLRV